MPVSVPGNTDLEVSLPNDKVPYSSFVMDHSSRVIRRKIKFQRACIYENRYIISQKDCLLQSPAILKYDICNTVGMQNVLTFTGSECLTACILKYWNSVCIIQSIITWKLYWLVMRNKLHRKYIKYTTT